MFCHSRRFRHHHHLDIIHLDSRISSIYVPSIDVLHAEHMIAYDRNGIEIEIGTINKILMELNWNTIVWWSREKKDETMRDKCQWRGETHNADAVGVAAAFISTIIYHWHWVQHGSCVLSTSPIKMFYTTPMQTIYNANSNSDMTRTLQMYQVAGQLGEENSSCCFFVGWW